MKKDNTLILLDFFKKELLRFNKHINLFSRKGGQKELDFLFKEAHIYAPFFKEEFSKFKSSILDLGSGNGFPGLFFAILYPENKFILCDRNQKKAGFLRHISFEMGLKNVEILNQSHEQLPRFQLILSKALAPWPKILDILEPVLASDGKAFLWKTQDFKLDHQKNFCALPYKAYQIEQRKGLIVELNRA